MEQSGDHAQLRTRKLVFKQPVAEVDGEIDLIGLADFHKVTILVHVDRNEVVANFRRVLGSVGQTELVVLSSFGQLWLFFQKNLITLDALLPADFVEAFSKKDDVGKNCLVKHLVSLSGCPVEIQSKDLIHQHVQFVVMTQLVVVSLPVFGLRIFICAFSSIFVFLVCLFSGLFILFWML